MFFSYGVESGLLVEFVVIVVVDGLVVLLVVVV